MSNLLLFSFDWFAFYKKLLEEDLGYLRDPYFSNGLTLSQVDVGSLHSLVALFMSWSTVNSCLKDHGHLTEKR